MCTDTKQKKKGTVFWLYQKIWVWRNIDHALSYVLKEKLQSNNVMVTLWKDLKTVQGFMARYIHCDNSHENEAFERLCKQEAMSIKF